MTYYDLLWKFTPDAIIERLDKKYHTDEGELEQFRTFCEKLMYYTERVVTNFEIVIEVVKENNDEYEIIYCRIPYHHTHYMITYPDVISYSIYYQLFETYPSIDIAVDVLVEAFGNSNVK